MLAKEQLHMCVPWKIWGKVTDEGVEPPKVCQ